MKISSRLVIILIIIGVVGALWALYWALPSSPDGAAGWWQVALSFLGVPIILYQLAKINEQIEQAQWRPDIHIGVMQHPLNSEAISAIETETNLPTEIYPRKAANFYVSAIIQNRGDLTARSTKIRLSPSFDEKTYTPKLPSFLRSRVGMPTGIRRPSYQVGVPTLEHWNQKKIV